MRIEDYDFLNGLSPEEAEAVKRLNPKQIEAAYRFQEYAYRVDDAERHAEILYPGKFGQDDYEEMAAVFLNELDCDIAENEQWDMIVESAAALKGDDDDEKPDSGRQAAPKM